MPRYRVNYEFPHGGTITGSLVVEADNEDGAADEAYIENGGPDGFDCEVEEITEDEDASGG